MADKKISDENDGSPALDGDLIRIARSGNNFRLSLSAIKTYLQTAFASVFAAISHTHSYLSSESDPVFVASLAHGIASGDITNWNNKTEKWKQLTATTQFSTTAASTSTIPLAVDLTASIKKGYGLKIKLSGTYQYAFVKNITSNLLTIGGVALTTGSGALQELYYSPLPGSTEMIAIVLPGACLATASTNLVAEILKTAIKWDKPDAYIVYMCTKVATDDSGATQPKVNIVNAGNKICTSNGSDGLSVDETFGETSIDISSTYYALAFGNAIEISTDGAGSNDDAADLTVQFLVVYP